MEGTSAKNGIPFFVSLFSFQVGEDFLPSQNPNLKLKENHSYLNLHPPHLNQSTEVRQVVS